MLEAKMQQTCTLKKLLDGVFLIPTLDDLSWTLPTDRRHRVIPAVKEHVADANFQCDDEGIKLQARVNSHVALVSLNLETNALKRYRYATTPCGLASNSRVAPQS